jgi:lipoprotein-anchoring transpeptidase ErfK/SrfK
MGPRLRRTIVAVAIALTAFESVAVATSISHATAEPLAARSHAVHATTAPSTDARSTEVHLHVPSAPSHASTRTLLVRIERPMALRARPGAGRVVGTMPSGSRFYDASIVAWVREVSRNGRFGLVPVPYVEGDREGWIALRGLDTAHTTISVEVDLSAHRLTVRRGQDVLFGSRAGIGAPASPTPAGHYFVTDRVAFPGGGSLGTFAFGISGIQPNLPAGWSGGDQLAIHGTNDPSSIGRSESAGCVRVSEATLHRLEPLLRLGTPVVIHP